MPKAGDLLKARRQSGVVGAFLKSGNRCIGVTAFHVIRLAGTKTLAVGNVKAEVVFDWKAFDLAYFKASGCEVTPMGLPSLGPAQLVNAMGTKECRISDVGDLVTVVLRCADLPGPGESGTPLFQEDKVVGILSSINLNNCKGTIISSRIIMKGAEGRFLTRSRSAF